MKIVIGTDEARSVVDHLATHLREKGHAVEVLPVATWGSMASGAARLVAQRTYDRGIVCCWTGTGASIAANKVDGVRAALCVDAETARGARKWNDANVLALSLRLVSEPIAVEIADAFLETEYAGTEDASLQVISEEERP